MASGERLDALPSMGGLLFRALMKSGRKMKPGELMPPLDVEVLGETFRPDPLEAYRQNCGSPPGEGLPGAAPHILAAPLHLYLLTRPASPLKAMGLIHVRNQIVSHQVIPNDAVMDIRVGVSKTEWVHKGLEMDVRTEVSIEGVLVWEETSVIFSRQPGAADIPRKPREQLQWWLETAGTQWGLAGNAGRRYAAVSGDWNPIHLYGATASLFGFKRPIIHGMWSLARCLAEYPSGAFSYDVEFRRPIALPGLIEFRREEGEGGASRFALVRPEDGKEYLVGSYTPNPS